MNTVRHFDKKVTTPKSEKSILWISFVLTQLFAITSLTFSTLWICIAYGFKAFSSYKGYNTHQTLMICFLICIGNSLLVFRVCRCLSYTFAQIVHLCLIIVGIACAFVAINAAALFNKYVASIPHLYSLHSWIALFTVTLVVILIVISIFIYVLPSNPVTRKIFHSRHAYFGTVIFILILIVVVAGVSQRAYLIISRSDRNFKKQHYQTFTFQNVVVNILGISVVAFGGLVLFIVSNPAFTPPRKKRR